jgi:hypothetical protein
LLYPDHPFDIGEIWGKRLNPQTKVYERFLVTEAPDLSKEVVYPKERRLIEDIRTELRHGRRCQVYATGILDRYSATWNVCSGAALQARNEEGVFGRGAIVAYISFSIPSPVLG